MKIVVFYYIPPKFKLQHIIYHNKTIIDQTTI